MDRTGSSIALGRFRVGPGSPCLIVAEVSCNHRGRFSEALDLVFLAHQAGADAVKFQHFDPLEMAPVGRVLDSGLWAGRELRDLYREAETPAGWLPSLFAQAEGLGLLAFSSVAHLAGADYLASIGAPCYKVASFELTAEPLLAHLSGKGLPVILSTGMASDPEIRRAIDLLYPCPVVLLHCVSAYPTPLSHANLPRIAELGQNFSRPVGLSWHNRSPAPPVVAAAFGIAVLEVHLTASHRNPTLDDTFSYDPGEFAQLVRLVRDAESLGCRNRAEVEAPQRALRRPAAGGPRGWA